MLILLECVNTATIGSKCIGVNGQMTVYISELRLLLAHRKAISLKQTIAEVSSNISQIIDNGMKSGRFLSVSPDIQGLTYLGSGNNQNSQAKHENTFPNYGYAVIIISIIAITVFSFAALKVIKKKRAVDPASSNLNDIENDLTSHDITISSLFDQVELSDGGARNAETSKNTITHSIDSTKNRTALNQTDETAVIEQARPYGDNTAHPFLGNVRRSHVDLSNIDEIDKSSFASENDSNLSPLSPSPVTNSKRFRHFVDTSPHATESKMKRTYTDQSVLNKNDEDSNSSPLSPSAVTNTTLVRRFDDAIETAKLVTFVQSLSEHQ